MIYNPAAGRGRAARMIRDVGPGYELRPTSKPGEARDLAQRACEEGFAVVVAAGGDGTVHEVVNGILAANRPEVVFAAWPFGSMNDYAYTLGFAKQWRERLARCETVRADVGQLRWGGRSVHFANGCGIGFNGMVTVEARKIRRLRGLPLYSLAVLRALRKHFAAPVMEILRDGQTESRPLLAFSLGLGQREGGFPLLPLAKLDDGLFDWLHIEDIARWEILRYFPGMVRGHLPLAHAKVRVGRCSRVRIVSPVPLCVHADGELVCVPADDVRTLEVELLPGRLRVATWPAERYGGSRFAKLEAVYRNAIGPRRNAAGRE